MTMPMLVTTSAGVKAARAPPMNKAPAKRDATERNNMLRVGEMKKWLETGY